jgi:hypothetical protein
MLFANPPLQSMGGPINGLLVLSPILTWVDTREVCTHAMTEAEKQWSE